MKNIFKKITISLLAFTLVFSSVNTYTFINHDYIEVNASMTTELRNKAMALLAVILASVGVKITSDVDVVNLEKIYNNLTPTAKTVIDEFDYQNKSYQGYYGLHVGQYAEVAHSLINTMKLWTMGIGAKIVLDNNGELKSDFKDFVGSSVIFTGLGQGVKEYDINGYSYSIIDTSSYSFPMSYLELDQLQVKNQLLNFTYLNAYISAVSFSNLSYKISDTEFNTGKTLTANDIVLSFVYETDGIINNVPKRGNKYYFPLLSNYATSYRNVTLNSAIAGLFTMAYDGMTLPAPPGGWVDSEPGDIDVPSNWRKALDYLGLPLVVLGGLNAQQLEDLKNTGPNDVTLGDIPEEVEEVLTRDLDVDTGVDVIDPTFPSIDIGDLMTDMAGWLAGALGALSGAIAGTLGNVGNAIGSILGSIWSTIKDILTAILGLAASIALAIAAVFAPLFDWLSEISLNWDWLKNILNWIKDFFQFIWEILKFIMNLFRYLFNYFILLLDLLYTMFFSGLLTVLVTLSSRIKTLFSVLPSPMNTIANMTYDVSIFGLILAIVRNVLFMFRGKK